MSKKMNNEINNNFTAGNDINIGNENRFTSKQNKNNNVDKSNSNKTVNVYNSVDDFNKNKSKYENLERSGIYHKVDEIITCEVIITDQTRIVKSTGKEYVVCINVLENGKLISNHIHVDFGNYSIPNSRRISITGKVYAYGPDNDKRGIALIEEPIELPDSYITNEHSCLQYPSYIDKKTIDKIIEQMVVYKDKDDYNILIHRLRKILNEKTASRLGYDTIFNYIATQITLNVNNNLIYNNKLYKYEKVILFCMAKILASTLYDLSKLMDDERYVRDERHGYDEKFAEINIFNIFRDIVIKCNSIQGLNGHDIKTSIESPESFIKFCKKLNIKDNLAMSHTVKHRYSNFDLKEEDDIFFNDNKAFIVLERII